MLSAGVLSIYKADMGAMVGAWFSLQKELHLFTKDVNPPGTYWTYHNVDDE
jgi:hypothetical protein